MRNMHKGTCGKKYDDEEWNKTFEKLKTHITKHGLKKTKTGLSIKDFSNAKEYSKLNGWISYQNGMKHEGHWYDW